MAKITQIIKIAGFSTNMEPFSCFDSLIASCHNVWSGRTSLLIGTRLPPEMNC